MEFMTQQRTDDDAGTDRLQSLFEYEDIDLFRLEDRSVISKYQQPYRVGFMQFLNLIQMMNQTEVEELQLSDAILMNPPGVASLSPSRLDS